MTATSLVRLSLFVVCLNACVSGNHGAIPWDDDAGTPTGDASPEDLLPDEIVDPDPSDDVEEVVLKNEVALGGQLSDIAGHPAEEEIRALSDRGFVAGFPDGTFRPNAAVTRAQFAAMVDSAFLADRPASRASFRDVPSSHWAAGAIGRANAAGFLRGYPDGAFRPDQSITRVEVVVALANGLGFSQGEWRFTAGRFTDSANVADWARASVANADAEGMFSNARLHQGRLHPTQAASRGVVASYVYLAQVLVIACNESRSECQFDDPRNKAVIVLGGVALSVYAVAAIWVTAVGLAYIASRPRQPTFGEMVSDLRRLSGRQLATAMRTAASSRRCNDATYERLVNAKESACARARSCNVHQSCAELSSRISAGSQCASARRNVMDICFAGGDARHLAELDEVLEVLQACQSILSGKRYRREC